jgi:hypothetical protein
VFNADKSSPSGERKRNAGVADLGFVIRSQHREARKGVHVIGPSDENIAASLVADLENKPVSQCTKVSQSWRHPLRAPFSTTDLGLSVEVYRIYKTLCIFTSM